MREIKFRGKCVADSKYADEWVTGGYVQSESFCSNKQEGLIVSYLGGNCTQTCHVDVSTIGQFTGLHDKNGREIYEGDRILLEFVGAFDVRYSTSMCQFGLYGERGFVDALKELQADMYVVIGNIYDNIDLIKNK